MLTHIRMFITGNNFFESADYCMNAKDSFLKGFDTPVIVNYAFACEVYLKALLFFLQTSKKLNTHKLFDLYKNLPEAQQKNIAIQMYNQNVLLKDGLGRSQLENISEAFVKWRYSYEYSTLHIDTSYLQAFCKVLREECSKTFFNSTWDDVKGKI